MNHKKAVITGIKSRKRVESHPLSVRTTRQGWKKYRRARKMSATIGYSKQDQARSKKNAVEMEALTARLMAGEISYKQYRRMSARLTPDVSRMMGKRLVAGKVKVSS